MQSLKSLIFGKKAVPIIDVLQETTRDGINKAYIPKFLYKPPYGYPRYANMPYIRYLAQTPYVEMCIDTILQKICSVEWDVIPNPDIPEEEFKDENGEWNDQTVADILHIKSWIENPNTNPDETFEDVFIKMPIRDVLEINSGIVNKVYNMKGEMVEAVARDGATFTKNPDIHGMMTDRLDILLPKEIVQNPGEVINSFRQISHNVVTESAAYFQYGWIAGPIPQPFGKREIMWYAKMKRSDDIYAYSAIQILGKTLQRLLYDIESDIEYYNDNNVPKGIIGLDASDSDEIKSFKEQWQDVQHKRDEFGNIRRMIHKVPIVNYIPKFERIEFSSEELQLIEKQKWYTKMVWACFGVTSNELSYTEDSQGTANQIVQSKVFREKTINPLLRMVASKMNREILPEFDYVYVFKKAGKIIPLPRYVFKFQMFDVDDEKAKAELYEKQIDNGIKTVNEIRVAEGDKPVEWGDERPQKFREQAQSFNFGNDPDMNQRKEDALDTSKNGKKVPGTNSPDKNKKKMESELQNKSIENKDLHDFVNEGSDTEMLRSSIAAELSAISLYENMAKKTKDAKLKKIFLDIAKEEKIHVGEFNYLLEGVKDPDADKASEEGQKEAKKKVSGKAQGMDSPLKLGEFEQPNEDKLKKGLVYLIRSNESLIKEIVKKEMEEGVFKNIKSLSDEDRNLIEIKGLPEVSNRIKGLLDWSGIKELTYLVVKSEFLSGAEESEEKINKTKSYNYVPDNDAIDFVANHTFSNIKGMTEDIADKLRGELQRGFMNGEGPKELSARIKSVFEIGETRAEAIARTESSRAKSYGKISAFRQSGIKAKKWILWTDDNRTSPVTKALHSKYGSVEKGIPLDENFKCNVKVGKKNVLINQQGPPFHVNERDELIIEPDEN